MAVSGQFQSSFAEVNGSFNPQKKWEAISILPPIPKQNSKKTSTMHLHNIFYL